MSRIPAALLWVKFLLLTSGQATAADSALPLHNEKPGDSYTYRTLDLFSGVEDGRYQWRITGVEPDRLVFNDGYWITDRLGNDVRLGIGATISGMELFVAEPRVGKTWTTRYEYTRADGAVFVITADLAVVAQEQVTVPAGTFDTYRVEGGGYIHQISGLRQGRTCDRTSAFKIWVAPDRVARFVAEEYKQQGSHVGCSHYYAVTRTELVAYGSDSNGASAARIFSQDPRGHHSQIRRHPVSGIDD